MPINIITLGDTMKAFHEKNIYPDGFPVGILKFNQFSFLPHWHNDVEIIYVYEGNLRMTVNSETRILSAGESCICCSGDIHSYDSSDLHCNAIFVLFNTEIIDKQIQWPQDAMFITPFIDETILRKYNISSDFPKQIGDLLIDVYHELEEKKEYYQVFVRSKLLELNGLILRNFPRRLSKANHLKSYTMVNKIQNALDYINCNYTEDIRLSDIAVLAELQISQFSKLFKHMCGMTFVNYLNNVRISKAEEKIINSMEPITDIALACGFNSIRNFNRTFKKLKNTSPSDLRKLSASSKTSFGDIM